MKLRTTLLALALGGALTLGVAPLALADPTGTTSPDATSTSSATAKPVLKLSARTVDAGDPVTVSGSGLPAGVEMKIVVTTANSDDPGIVYPATVSADGTLTTTVQAPTGGGELVVIAVHGDRWLAQAPLTVIAKYTLTVSPNSVRPGQKVRVFGDGHHPNGLVKVTIALAGTEDPGTTWEAPLNGRGGFDVTVPAPKVAGHYTVIIQNAYLDGGILIQTPLTVTGGTQPALPSTGA